MSKQIQDAYIVSATRTPVGKAPRGVFRNTRPDDMLAFAIDAALSKFPQIDKARIDDAVIGCAMPEAEQGMNVARIAVLLAGLPNVVSAVTVNRFCSSGLQAVAMAADRIRLGEADLMIAGGTETHEHGADDGLSPGVQSVDLRQRAHRHRLRHGYHGREGRRAVAGHARTAGCVRGREPREGARGDRGRRVRRRDHAVRARRPLPESGRRGITTDDSRIVKNDEGPRAGTTAEVLAKLKPVFRANGSVTAGNSSQMSDGAGAVLLASEQAIKDYNLTPLARFVGFAVAGVPPEIMGIGPKAAIPKALKQTGIKQDDLDWIELNEAFAAQALAVIKDLGLNPDKVNPLGGAIALGHPLGATGAIRVATLLSGLRRRKQKYGMVTMCIGTGMGAAGVFEAL